MIIFLLEQTLINLVPVLLGMAVAGAYIRISPRVLSVVFGGTCAGLLAYNSFSIPDRSFEVLEFILLAFSHAIFSAALWGFFVVLKAGVRKAMPQQRAQSEDSGAA